MFIADEDKNKPHQCSLDTCFVRERCAREYTNTLFDVTPKSWALAQVKSTNGRIFFVNAKKKPKKKVDGILSHLFRSGFLVFFLFICVASRKSNAKKSTQLDIFSARFLLNFRDNLQNNLPVVVEPVRAIRVIVLNNPFAWRLCAGKWYIFLVWFCVQWEIIIMWAPMLNYAWQKAARTLRTTSIN